MVGLSLPTVSYGPHASPYELITEVSECAGQHIPSRLQYSTSSGLVRSMSSYSSFLSSILEYRREPYTRIAVW